MSLKSVRSIYGLSAGRFGISSEWNVPDEAFMILILDRKAMNGITGVARYRQEWAEAM